MARRFLACTGQFFLSLMSFRSVSGICSLPTLRMHSSSCCCAPVSRPSSRALSAFRAEIVLVAVASSVCRRRFSVSTDSSSWTRWMSSRFLSSNSCTAPAMRSMSALNSAMSAASSIASSGCSGILTSQAWPLRPLWSLSPPRRTNSMKPRLVRCRTKYLAWPSSAPICSISALVGLEVMK